MNYEIKIKHFSSILVCFESHHPGKDMWSNFRNERMPITKRLVSTGFTEHQDWQIPLSGHLPVSRGKCIRFVMHKLHIITGGYHQKGVLYVIWIHVISNDCLLFTEGPMSHDQPTYASVPGIRVYGMMCVQPQQNQYTSQSQG